MNTPENLPPQRSGKPPQVTPQSGPVPPQRAQAPPPVRTNNPGQPAAPVAATSPVVAAPTQKKGGIGKLLLLAIGALLLAGLVAGGGYFALDRINAGGEADAVAKLKEFGAIPSFRKKRLDTIALSTVRDPANLPAAIDLLKKCKKVSSITFQATALSDADMEKIAACTNLTNLNLRETQITDEGVKQLANLPKLQTLDLSATQVTSASFDVISKLPKLKVLTLSGTNVNGGLTPLASTPELKWLLLENLTIEDDSIGDLGGCTIQRITLRGAKLNDESVLSKLTGVKLDR